MTRTRTLTIAAFALATAVVFAPSLLASPVVDDYSGVGELRAGLPGAFAEHWESGGPVTGDLARSVDFWTTFHVVKAAAAALLLGVLVVALGRVRQRSARVAVIALAGLTAVIALANIQGAVAPLSSLLTMVPSDANRAALAADGSPAFSALVDDFALFHAAMVVLAGAASVAVTALAVRGWRRGSRAAAVCALGAAVVLGVVALANLSTATDPEPALLAFLGQGVV